MITLDKAKEILGEDAKGLSDDQIIKCVNSLYEMANFVLESYRTMTPEQRRNISKRHKTNKS